jgi:hypothetical protein
MGLTAAALFVRGSTISHSNRNAPLNLFTFTPFQGMQINCSTGGSGEQCTLLLTNMATRTFWTCVILRLEFVCGGNYELKFTFGRKFSIRIEAL